MKLEGGMYVRTKVGIFKIRKITKDLAYWKHEKRVIELDRNIPKYNYRFSFYKDEIIFKGAKFKDNIIDLIEVGDYVNGELVTFISSNPKNNQYGKPRIILNNSYSLFGKYEEINSIVTKEQFKSMKYEVKKDE